MAERPRLLVIGSSELRGDVARALPECVVLGRGTLLAGLWAAGHERPRGIVLALGTGTDVRRVLPHLRQVAADARIVLACPTTAEPHAREALKAGADDYVLEPLAGQDLATALRVRAAGPPAVALAAGTESGPTLAELHGLSDVLRSLREGPSAVLARLARVLREAFDAVGLRVSVDELSATDGDPEGAAVLSEPVLRGGTAVGCIALGRRRAGPYTARDAARLADYAALVEALVAQAREQAHWQDLAWRDDLSGLRNRRYFEGVLDRLLDECRAGRRRLTVLLFDIDDFKTYNDRYGHDTGDALLREVATLLTRCCRERDVVARYGGDEFAVIFWDAERPRVPGSQHPASAVALAERFGAVIRGHRFQCLGTQAPGPVTISGGLACFPWDATDRAGLLRAADAALLAAKREGKDRIVLAGPASEEQGVRPPPGAAGPA